MPKFQDSLALQNTNANTALAAAYQTFKTLGWDVQYAGADRLTGHTQKNWKSKGQQIVVGAAGNSLDIQSIMVYNESFDLSGANKKNVAAFKAAFENILQNIDPDTISANTVALENIRAETQIAAAQEAAEAEEINKAMNLAGSNLYATYTIIGLNVLVFILMALNGAGIMDLNALVHIKWGSNFSPLTLSGDWWRLFTNIFIHFGIIHLLMNMYAFYMVGIYLEPMLGKIKFVVSYICTGILASVASLWWHTDTVNSAGASGAIFGMYGLFLALLTTDLIPAKVRKALLQSIGIFVIYNLAYGMKGGIDNAAHIGGLISGFVFGYLFVIAIKAEKREQKGNWILPAIIIISCAISSAYLSAHKASGDDRAKISAQIKEGAYKDNDTFDDKYNEFVEFQIIALAPLDSNYTQDVLSRKLSEISIPAWEKASAIAGGLKDLDVSPAKQQKADAVMQYILLRKEQLQLLKNFTNNDSAFTEKNNELNKKISAVMETLK